MKQKSPAINVKEVDLEETFKYRILESNDIIGIQVFYAFPSFSV